MDLSAKCDINMRIDAQRLQIRSPFPGHTSLTSDSSKQFFDEPVAAGLCLL